MKLPKVDQDVNQQNYKEARINIG